MSPNCKIVNFTSESSDWVAHLILENQHQPVNRICDWNIVTKYYTATVQLHFLDADQVLEDGDTELCNFDDTEAVIFICTKSKTCLENCDQLWKRIQEQSPAVCLYVVKSVVEESSVSSDPEVSRAKILDWCLNNNFELVECDDRDISDTNDHYEPEGEDRISEALKAHTWSNLQLAEEKREILSTGLDSALDNLNLGDEDLNFEDLFSQLSKMKEASKHLPDSERKDFAEKVALAFLNSVGEDEDDED